eukprot:447510-Pelagomonas_calceolata.AAC.1
MLAEVDAKVLASTKPECLGCPRSSGRPIPVQQGSSSGSRCISGGNTTQAVSTSRPVAAAAAAAARAGEAIY